MIRPVAAHRAEAAAARCEQMVDGLSYVRHNRLVLGAITLDLFAVLLGGATAMLPVYARDIFQVGADGPRPFARRAGGRGDADRDLFLVPAAEDATSASRCWLRSVVFGAATIVFGLSRIYAAVARAAGVLGAADMFSVYVRQSLIQLHTPDEMRGRVAAGLDARHFRLQRAWRDPKRLHRGLARPGRRDRRRRHRARSRSP